MTPLIKKYPLDLTGSSPNNLVISEPHTLVANGRDGLRVFVLQQGSFYTRSLVVRDANGVALTPNSDYIATYLYEDASKRTGLEVCGALVVKNPRVSAQVYVDYQCVGGDYAQSTDALEQVLQALQDDTRPVEWGNILGKPTEYPPGGHMHALWELYGFEYVVTELERITQAIMVGDQAAFDDVRAYAYRLYEDGKAYTDAQGQRLDDHIANKLNPHGVTKAQVQLGNVQNYPVASSAQAIDPSVNNRYVTPYHVDLAISHRQQDLNASRLTSGRVPDARLYGSYTGLTSLTSDRYLGSASDGTSNPSFSWAGDTNTGMYRASSTQIAWSINGVKTASIDPTQFWTSGDVRGFSDARLKRNFEVFTDAVAKVKQLRGGIYERIDLDGQRQVGMIAQDVLEVLPEVVGKDEETGYYGLSYANLVALLVEAIKEQSTTIQCLDERLTALEMV